MHLEESMKLLERAKKVVPGGLFGHFRFPSMMQQGAFPLFAKKAKGCHFWDADGKDYIDYVNGFGCNLLGYHFDPIEDFIAQNRSDGDCLGIPKPCYIELAEEVVETFHSADWAIFAKNGSDVTSIAVVAARAYTGKKKIIAITGGFNGSHINWGWCNPGNGRSPDDYESTIFCNWNDSSRLETIFKENLNEICGIIITPVFQPVYGDSSLPDPQFIDTINKMKKEHNFILILDEVRTGLHISVKGSDLFFGYHSDLVCYSKALGNTHAIACLAGGKKMYETMGEIFFSGTFWASEPPILAAMAVLKYMKANGVIEKINESGKTLQEGMLQLAEIHSVPIKISGPLSMPYARLLDDKPGECGLALDFAVELSQHGVFIHPFHNWSLTYSHEEKDILQTLDVMEKAFVKLKAKHY